ncbi:LysM peptidoglycan-binding domain-containing protein [bacterium]|nr:LysM peptidoglycan-binding domain-containing protein [bacterium]
MTLEEYNQALVKCKENQRALKADIAKLEEEIKDLESELSELDDKIAYTKREIYRLVGYDQSGIDAFVRELDTVKQQILGLMRLSSEELYEKLDEVEAIGKRLDEMKADKRAKLPDVAVKLREVLNLYDQLKEKARNAKPKIGRYTVLKGDYLWKISKKDEIYGDPYQWMRIYSFNRDGISNPDLIYPNQILMIHKVVEKGQYLVQKGDFLRKIAGMPSVYNDPYQWKKLYEGNKTIIADQNLIYPHTILFVP